MKRSITLSEAHVLVHALQATPNITGYSVKEWMSFSDVWVHESNGKIAGVATSQDFGSYWTYMAVLFVFPEFQKQGIGKELFTAQIEDIKQRKCGAYTCSHTPAVLTWMKECGMSLSTNMWKSPVLILIYYCTFYLTLYRLKEFLRKRKIFSDQPEWVYGKVKF